MSIGVCSFRNDRDHDVEICFELCILTGCACTKYLASSCSWLRPCWLKTKQTCYMTERGLLHRVMNEKQRLTRYTKCWTIAKDSNPSSHGSLTSIVSAHFPPLINFVYFTSNQPSFHHCAHFNLIFKMTTPAHRDVVLSRCAHATLFPSSIWYQRIWRNCARETSLMFILVSVLVLVAFFIAQFLNNNETDLGLGLLPCDSLPFNPYSKIPVTAAHCCAGNESKVVLFCVWINLFVIVISGILEYI